MTTTKTINFPSGPVVIVTTRKADLSGWLPR